MTGTKNLLELPPVEEVDVSTVTYMSQRIKAPHLTGFGLQFFVWTLESRLGPLLLSSLKRKNKFTQFMEDTVIPETPMYFPEYPPQEKEPGVVIINEESGSISRLESAVTCLPPYEPSKHFNSDSSEPFLYWTIRDYAHAYRSGLTTPSAVAERIITVVDDYNHRDPPMPLLIYFDADDVRKQAAQSTHRFEQGKPLSILDGIFMPIKDDVDCFPYPTKGGSTWFHEVRPIKKDAVCVSRLRDSGVIFIGKANMHEFGLGTTGSNPNYGTARNPHALNRYTGGSSSGPAAIVSCGLCPAAVGTDGGGSIRIPSALCGVVGLKTNFSRIDMEGVLCNAGTVEVVAPIAANVEDALLVYTVMAGASPAKKIILNPSPLSLPNLSCSDNTDILRSLKVGKYTAWFNDVLSKDISDTCTDAINLLSSTSGCQIVEITLPQLQEMSASHVVSIGAESQCPLNPYHKNRWHKESTLDTRASLALFQSYSAAEYCSAQRLRRRIMHYFMEAFKKTDIIVTPTTGMTAPEIHSSALKLGETNYEVQGYLMQFIVAANFLGFPAISVPVGHDKQGLPIGLQLIGRPWGEATILRVASAIEHLCLPSRKRPATFYDILK